MDQEERWLKEALDLAVMGKGLTFPNPMVGAVVVKDGLIVGKGYHRKAGGPHAEIVALEAARGNVRGAALYVNLEPCNHHGHTPPCTEAIIGAGIRRVVCSTEDPNPRVSGKGLKRLEEAGLEVLVGPMAEEAKRLNEVYFKNMSTGLPFVALKIAQSLDGRIATRLGDSRWITGTESRRYIHRLRSESDAILVGIGTVIADNPLLTVREIGTVRTPLRVALDTHLRIPPGANLLDPSSGYKTLIYTGVEEVRDDRFARIRGEGVSIQAIRDSGKELDLDAVLRDLYRRGVSSLLVEGGTRVFTSFLGGGWVDKLYTFIGPIILGGGGSFPSFDDLSISSIEGAIRLKVVESHGLGQDTLIISYPSYPRPAGESAADVHGDR